MTAEFPSATSARSFNISDFELRCIVRPLLSKHSCTFLEAVANFGAHLAQQGKGVIFRFVGHGGHSSVFGFQKIGPALRQ